MNFTNDPTSDASPLFAKRDAIFADDLLAVALIELDLFTWLAAKGSASTADICDHFDLKRRGADVMITLLRARQLLSPAAGHPNAPDSPWCLTSMAAEFFASGSQWFLGPYYAMMRERSGVRDLLAMMRTGHPVFWGGKQEKKDDWHQAMTDLDYARSFTAAMDCRGLYFARALWKSLDLSGFSRVLDIAGGSGIYASSLVAHAPHVHAAVLERSPVHLVAEQLIAERSTDAEKGRISVIAGDMMTEALPAGFDAHLWSNVLHDWDVPEVHRLLQASAETLPSGGTLIIHDAFLNDALDGPLHAAEYAVTLAYATQGRCYGTSEMKEWLSAAGFGSASYHDTVAGRGVMIAQRL